MAKQRRISSNVVWIIGMAIVLILLSLASCGGPLPGSPKARTILSASDADRVDVLPDGRRILFWPKDSPSDLMMLDISTGERVRIAKDIDQARWLGDELLYGYQLTYTGIGYAYYVVNLQPLAVVGLETLAVGAESLPEGIRQADSIYAIVTGALNDKYLVLLLRLDMDRRAVGGYAVYDVHDPDALLAGYPYKIIPPFVYNPSGEHPSPDGEYYYTYGAGANPLRIYSQRGQLRNFVGPSRSDLGLICYGWAWDSSGVFIQEFGQGPLIGERPIGPLQLLEVK